MTTALSVLFGQRWSHYRALLLTCTVLIALLGLNESAIGLVYVPQGSLYLIVELFGLIVALNAAYVAVFFVLERGTLSSS